MIRGNEMKIILIYTDHLIHFRTLETYFPEQLIKAYESIGYVAFELPKSLQDQAS